MFVNNRSHHRPALARTLVSSQLAVAAVVVRSIWRISAAALLPWEGPRVEVTGEPASPSDHALWQGTSVTVSGNVPGPGRPPYVARVDLDVGPERRSLLVHGDRRWIRNAGRLAVSSAGPFDHKPLSWALAFGGGYALAPGLDPLGKRPHPGGWIAHVLNPGGTGLYGDEGAADGAPLPSIERPEEPIASWRDQPRPAGLSPCPSLHGLRAPVTLPREDPDWHVRAALRLLHPGPGELIFEPLRPGCACGSRGSPRGRSSWMCRPPRCAC